MVFSNSQEVNMPFTVVNLTCDPEQPKAGTPFRLTVELDTVVQGSDVQVNLEKQRIVLGLDGVHTTRPTGINYFAI
jgi:hypothetical protein